MKKILIIYATYGSGHKAIAKYIKEYFTSKNKNIEVKLMDLLDYSNKSGKVSKKISEKLMLKYPVVWNALFKWADHKYTSRLTNKVSLKWFSKKRIFDEITTYNPDLIICTHFYGSCFVADLNAKEYDRYKAITIITDYDIHNIWLEHYRKNEYIVVPSKVDKRNLSEFIPKKYIKPFGIPIFPKEEDILKKQKILNKLGLNPKKKTCVCFSGGGNGSVATIPYIKSLLKAQPDINYIFIAGNNPKAYKKINDLINKYKVKNVRLFGFVDNVPELLIASDFVVTKPGGAQSTECLYFKKPMLFMKSSGGQENSNISYFTKSGYARFFAHPKKLYRYFKKLDKNMADIEKMYRNLCRADNTKAMNKLYHLAIDMLKQRK